MGTGAFLYILILAVTCIISYMALQDRSMMSKYELHVGAIRGGEYQRLVTSGFLHVDLMHLFVNMLALVFAGEGMEFVFGPAGFLALYFGAMVGGSLLAVAIQRNNLSYRAVGASGAISGLIYAFAVLFPSAEIRLFFFIPMPAWIFAVLYTAYSLFGIRTRMHNLGHEAHLGGGLIGIAAGCLLYAINPIFPLSWVLVAVLVIPSAFFLYMFYTNPTWIYSPSSIFKMDWLKRNRSRSRPGPRPIYVRDQENRRVKQKGLESSSRADLEAEMNVLLELIHKRGGIHKLTRKEKARLDELRQILHGPSPTGPGHRAPSD